MVPCINDVVDLRKVSKRVKAVICILVILIIACPVVNFMKNRPREVRIFPSVFAFISLFMKLLASACIFMSIYNRNARTERISVMHNHVRKKYTNMSSKVSCMISILFCNPFHTYFHKVKTLLILDYSKTCLI